MFDDQQQPGSSSTSKKAAPPEDIFAGVDEAPRMPSPTSVPAPTNPVLEPSFQASPREASRAPLPPGLLDDETFSTPPRLAPDAMHATSMRSHGRAVKKMVLVAVVVVLVIIAAVLLTSLILRSRKAVSPLSQPEPEAPGLTTPIEDLLNEPSRVLPGSTSPRVQDDFLLGTPEEPEPEPVPVDSDRDGLSDEEELSLGTSPRSADTDADGLSDRDEVKQWGTNPLNPDTDGDGYKDGAEVDNGYDPKGSGKLFEIPSE